ncbi:MAG TPA: hypothetical protein PKE69_19010 [Pyrinomonadaceae bacterium]|nr:hypothetical protein [Pyrinomonadaceae bacterium]
MYSGGIRIAVGDLTSDTADGILVSRISLPNSPSEAINALAPNAVVKARALFEAQRSWVTSLGVVFSIPKKRHFGANFDGQIFPNRRQQSDRRNSRT